MGIIFKKVLNIENLDNFGLYFKSKKEELENSIFNESNFPPNCQGEIIVKSSNGLNYFVQPPKQKQKNFNIEKSNYVNEEQKNNQIEMENYINMKKQQAKINYFKNRNIRFPVPEGRIRDESMKDHELFQNKIDLRKYINNNEFVNVVSICCLNLNR